MPKRIPAEQAAHYRKILKPITDTIVRYFMVGEEMPFAGRTKMSLLSRGLVMYFAAKRLPVLSHTEIAYAFNTDHTAVGRALHKFDNMGALQEHERKCLRDLLVLFQQADVASGVADTPAGMEKVSLYLDAPMLERLRRVHESGMFGTSPSATAKILLAYKLYELEPHPAQVALKEKSR